MSSNKALVAAALSLTSVTQAMPSRPSQKATCYWPGWAGIKHMFIFGDSYTQTGFNDTTGPQPTPGNPLGNPAYPGYTSSNGPNWIDFLTTTYNKTVVETVNLAYGGATVDGDLVAPYEPQVLSVKQQVQQEYLPVYASKKTLPWSSSDTLFGVFIGINDVGNSYYLNNATLNTAIFKVYSGLVDSLYKTGARNFLFLNVPPVDRSPLITAQGASAEASEKADIADFNSRIVALGKNLTKTYADAKVFQFDTNAIFTKVLNNPASYPQTAAYKNTTGYCPSYENGTPTWYTLDAECGIPVDEYFWLNTLHPTFRMHNATASAIAQQLSAAKC